MAQTVDEIAELLNDMRIENERSNDNFERVLTGINAKLELMSEDNKDDLIRVYISELKKALEDRHSSALIKFDEIQKSFNIIQKRQDDYAKSDELKELARALTANFNTFFTETANRKEILDKIEEKVSDIDSTALDKKEILSMLENISSDLLSINANIEKTFLETSEVVKNIDLSDDFSNISKQISTAKLI